MDEQQQADLVHPVALAEGERLAHEPGETLPQGVVPPLDVTRLPIALAGGLVLGLREHLGVGLLEVGEAQQAPVARRHAPPQPLAGLGPPVAHGERHDLARPPAQGQPDPPLVPAPADEGP